MGRQRYDQLKNICCELFAASGKILSWQWDSRFGMALAQFNVNEAEQVKTILEEYLSFSWSASDVDQSPEAVQGVVSSLGGLLPGQLLFTSPPDEIFMLCAWWPWNNGQTVSIRVTYYGAVLLHNEREEMTRLLKSQLD